MLTFRRSLLATLLMMVPRMATAQDPPAAKPIPGVDVFEAREFKGANGKTLRYRLLKPLGYGETKPAASDASAPEKFPLVLFLHGAGERGDDNARQLIHGGKNLADEALRRRHPAFVIAPQCPAEKKWVEFPWDGQKHPMPEQPSESLALVFELIDSMKQEYSIDENRIYGVGLSMGGFGTWDILSRKPELLAAAVPICGGGDPQYADRYKATPLWAVHGNADPVVFPKYSRDMVAALRAAGGQPIYSEYEGIGHDSWTQTFDNRLLWDWLFTQTKK